MGYKAFWEKLKLKECIFVAKQGLMRISDLRPKRRKMRNENKCGRPNMALHLNEVKGQNMV